MAKWKKKWMGALTVSREGNKRDRKKVKTLKENFK